MLAAKLEGVVGSEFVRMYCVCIRRRESMCELQSEYERYLTEKHAKKPVTVTNYPKEVFYTRLNDGWMVAAMHVLAWGSPKSSAKASARNGST
jgi:aspartyl/asparaginyl-tRNA synthetase